MKCFLHIGTEKTGTTTIQSFLSKNREYLKNQGFYYLESLGIPNNRYLSLLGFDRTRRDDFTKSHHLFTDEQIVDFQKKIKNDFKNEVKDLPKEAIVVFSNEHIQSRLTTSKEVNRLKIILNEVGFDDITVILYIRNPSETVNSLFSTAIKSGGTNHTVPLPSNEYWKNICDHKATIERFSTVFHKEKLSVRLFRKDKFKNASLVYDFANIIGLELIENKWNIPINQNESISLLGLKVLRRCNEKFLEEERRGNDNIRKDIISFISKYFSTPPYRMEKEIYMEYDSYFSDSNQWVKENYFPEEIELFPYHIPEQSHVDISEEELNNMVDFIMGIWISRANLLNNKWLLLSRKNKKGQLEFIFRLMIGRLKKRIILL